MTAFYTRTIVEKDLDVDNRGFINAAYELIYRDGERGQLTRKVFSDEKMIRTFPNLRMQNRNGDIIYFNSLFPDVRTYYFKIEKKNNQSE